ncbi:PD-(D/E)XK nuclease family protein [Alteromonas flava]|uniref:PDDEXK-like family protein n=1 Tax=Alteromonas flava TaxID=2048003 RepID=UPI0013DA297E|nr:PD-(D/E)XK nuclease family protein [Alteromonas flava]
MSSEIVSKLSSLIKDPALERLDLTISKPNIFEILRIAHTEIRHSNFLAWVLNPNQSHNLRDSFLKWFLKDVFSDSRVPWINEFRVDSIETDKLVVHREYKNIDLLLETSDFVVVIENKLWSKEHSNQLSRYSDTIDKDFSGKYHAFVFLTPYGESPEQDYDRDLYVTYGYASIVRILNIILDTYGHSLSEKITTYIKDYVDVLRRHVMQEDEAISIAQEIYKNHKDALDFIFENKPDRSSEIGATFGAAVKQAGYVLGTQNKGYCRFTTKALDNLLPKSSEVGWKQSESFLFEIRFYDGKVSLKCVVSPGEQAIRTKLITALQTIKGAKEPRGKQWATIHNHNWRINVNSEKYEELDVLKDDIELHLAREKDFISEVERAIAEAIKA